MAGKVRVNGTNYTITGGKCRVNGTNYAIKKGRALVGGTGYNIFLSDTVTVRVQLMNKQNTACYVSIYVNDLFYGRVSGGTFDATYTNVTAQPGDTIRIEPYLVEFSSCEDFTEYNVEDDIFIGLVPDYFFSQVTYIMRN